MIRHIVSALGRGVLVCDGALGTNLMAGGVEARCPDELNLIAPEMVRDLHAAYVAAGARVLMTNSIGGNRAKLARAGLADLTREVNLAAARLAREAAGEAVFVQGNLGPTGELLEPMGELTYRRATEIFREQAELLVEGGVDFLLVQTMFDLNEAVAAVEAAGSTGLPVVATMSFDGRGRTMMGVSPAQAVASLRSAGALAVGANCGIGPAENLAAVQEMHRADPKAWLMAQPNAGLPVVQGDRTIYPVTPAEMAAFVPAFLEAGVRLIGSCCGSTPEHTRAIAEAVNTRS